VLRSVAEPVGVVDFRCGGFILGCHV
jgi:hypothetical protein